jgi:succinate-semialdehyde dehydrogenase/glutarate-semialdehyde dehydrogenase
VAEVTDLTREDVGAAIEIAHKAFQVYKEMTARQRRLLLREWIDAIKENKEDLAAICTIELAKPFSESLVTVEYGLSFLERFEGLIEHVGGETIPAARNNNRIFTIRQPQGVGTLKIPIQATTNLEKWPR